MALTASGVTIPGSSPTTTAATPIQEHWNNLGKSLNPLVIVPTASVTSRAALVTARNAEGPVISASAPLRVSRADAPPGCEVESTINGSTWTTAVFTPQVSPGMYAVNVDVAGRVAIRPATGSSGPHIIDAGLLVEPRVAGAPGLVARGLAGQTAPLQQWQLSADFIVAHIAPSASPSGSFLALNFAGLGTRTLEIGAPDSAGAGYRAIRVAN